MKRLDHLVQLISQPWAIRPEVIEGWGQILDAKLAGGEIPEEFLAAGGGRSAGDKNEPFTRDGNLAIVPVVGTLVKSNSFFSCDATYAQLKSAMAAAESAKGIDALVLDGDTPGGTVAGLQEAADFIHKMNLRKPVFGWVDDLAASAGVWLLSQTRMIGAHPAADIGSIGVIAMHYDRSGRDAQNGVKRTVLAVGDYKAAGNDTGPMSGDERAYMMERLNQTYDLFMAAVNRGRPQLSIEQMRGMQSRVYKSAQAKELGLIDHVMGKDEYMDHVKRQLKGASTFPVKGARAMSTLTLEALRADHADLVAQIEADARVGFVAADAMSGGGPMCGTCSCKECAGGECATCTKNPHKASATTSTKNILALHGAVFGEDANKKFSAVVESGVTADQAKALGVTAEAGDEASRAAILQALHGAAPEGLKPGQVQNPAKVSIDTASIYAARQK